MPIKIDYSKCCWKDGKCQQCACAGACSGCVEICPVQAISRQELVMIDDSACIDCGACVYACQHSALSQI